MCTHYGTKGGVIIYPGKMSSSAESVANVAKVDLRTVFRDFSEMEVLYREISDALEKHTRL